MTALPQNFSLLSQTNFKFSIKRAPNVNYFVQKINVPEMKLSAAFSDNPFVRLKYPGDHLDLGVMTMEFVVNEDLGDYLEIFNWMIALGAPQNFDQFKQLKGKENISEGQFSDLSLMILSAQNNAKLEVTYRDAFPVFLSEISFDTTKADRPPITATAQFAYTLFEINPVK